MEINQSIDINPELTQILELVDKDIKIVIITICVQKIKQRHERHLKKQIEILELKPTMCEKKITLDWNNYSLNIAE